MWKGLGIGFGVGFVLGLLGDGLLGGIGIGIVFGFVGWLIGLIASSAKGSKAGTASAAGTGSTAGTGSNAGGTKTGMPGAPRVFDARIAALENRVAVLEIWIAKMAGETVMPFETVTSGFVPEGAVPATEVPIAIDVPPPIPVAGSAGTTADLLAQNAADIEPPVRTIPLPPREPPKPNPIVAWFTGGNTIVRVGIVVLFIGIAFLLRYSIEHGLVPPELRVAGIGFAGIVLLVLGWRLAPTRPGYALSLQGAGVGVLYLTVFGALRLYHLIPPELAFPLLVVIAALATWLAVRQDSAALACFGAAGGFIAPVLASTGRGDHVMLFSYFAVLNAAILTTAWFKAWRSLNLIGFAFTFVIGLAWGAKFYKPEHFATVEPFLILFGLMYVAVAVLFARREATPAGRRVDGSIVFGVPLVGFGMQSAMLKDTEYGLAISAIVLAAFYLALATVLNRRAGEGYRLLVRAFLALGVVFITVAIPLAFDARWTSAAWAVEGAAVLWMGARQGRWVPQAFGALVQLAAGVSFGLAHGSIPREMLFINGSFMGFAMIAAAGLFSHLSLRAVPESRLSLLRPVFFWWALFWWVAGLCSELLWVYQRWDLNALGALLAATTLAFAAFHRDGKWPEAAWPSKLLLPAVWALVLLVWHDVGHPFANGGWAAWPFAIVAHLVARRWIEGESAEGGRYRALMHAGTLVLAAMIGAVELHYGMRMAELGHTAWSSAAIIVVPCLLIFAICSGEISRRWPVVANPSAYRLDGALVVLAGLFAWIFLVNATRPGPSDPLPYLPLVNAIDLGHGLVALAIVTWWRALGRSGPARPAQLEGALGWTLLGMAAFVWANGVLLRSLHHWAGVPYYLDAWLRSFVTQASISIFWSLLALGLMVWATRNARRTVWMVGAALMAVVVAKLALVDFARLGGLERIVSFIGVGILMLVIGYFSPVPPRRKETQ